MNKFEKLIEYIINDEDQKARELFHDIVVEKSRDIYESIIDDEESVEEQVAGDQVGQMVDEIGAEESVHEEEDEFSIDDADADDEVSGDLPMDGDHGIEGDDMGAEPNHDETVMNIDAKLDELLAKFDEIMGDEGQGEEPAMGDEEPAMGGEEPTMDAEPEMMEGENPFAKSGKSGSTKSGISGKSGSAKSGTSGKSGSGKMESRTNKSTSELMREYVDRIGDIYGGAGDANEGDAVGSTGKKTSVNDKSIVGPGADFGGTTATPKGGEQNQDGTSPASTDKPQVNDAGNVNVPGGKAALGKGPVAKSGEESAVNDKPVQKQNTGAK